MNNIEKYIPEQYARNKHYAKKMVEKFTFLDFWEDYVDDFHEFLCSPTVNAWEESDVAEAYISFYRSGRNIIEIPHFLSKLLFFTDIDNVRLSDMKIPYEAIYFHFGEITDISIDGINENPYLVGAYVTKWRTEEVFSFVLCFSDSAHPYICFSLGADVNKKNKFQTVNESVVTTDEIDEGCYDYCFSGLKKECSNNGCNGIEDVIYKSIRLIVNCICYFNSIEKEIKLVTTNEQATELIQQLGKTKKYQQRTKLIQKLTKLSYSKIHILGYNLQKEYDGLNTGIEKEPHWRRGHWRNQPYGKGLSDSKFIWIKPTIVRRDKGEPDKGHIYNV